MCLIIAPGEEKPALLPRDVFNYVYPKNNDGFGAMWTEDGRVNHFKTLNLSADEVYATMEEYVERHPDVIFHMRYKTHGKVMPGLSHPFRVLHKNRHGKDLFFMHNGVLGQYGNNLSFGQSDTTVFKDKILVPLLSRDPNALEDPEVLAAINKLTSGSRLVFMDSDGKVTFTSGASWNDRYGLKLSNEYMLPPKPYTSSYSSTSSKAAVITAQYTYYRWIRDADGKALGRWCSCPKPGFVRTETGQLYRDAGANKTIYHVSDAIPKDKEAEVLAGGVHLVETVSPKDIAPIPSADDLLDDDIPFDLTEAADNDDNKDLPTVLDILMEEDTGKGVASLDARLRYARLVHNLYAGTCTNRTQLLGDLIGMQDEEMFGFIKEDPENTQVVLAELIEIICEMNDALWIAEPTSNKVFDANELIARGEYVNHNDSMKLITELRKQEYMKKVKDKQNDVQQRVEESYKKAWGDKSEDSPEGKDLKDKSKKNKKQRKAA